jgi:hypothetical protein
MTDSYNPFAIEQTEPESMPNPYQELYELAQNPFPNSPTIQPLSGDKRSNGELFNARVREEEEKEFRQKFLSAVTGDEVYLGLLRYGGAPYARGQGKSAFLYHLSRLVHQARRQERADCLAVFLQPQARVLKKYWQILRLVWKYLAQPVDLDSTLTQLDEADRLLRTRALRKLLSPEKLKELASLSPSEAIELLSSMQMIVERLDISIEQLNQEILALIQVASDSMLSPTFAEVLIDGNFTLANTWKVVEKWSDNRWRRDGTTAVLDGLAAALIAAGFRRLFVFFDQYETVFLYQNATDRSEFLDGLRGSIFDSDTVSARRNFLRVLLVIHPQVVDQIAGSWGRVGLDRFCPIIGSDARHNAITLRELDVPQLRDLLIGYLNAFRVPDDSRRDTIHPFTEAAFEALVAQSQGIAGYLLSYAHFMLAEAMRAKKTDVNEEIVKKVSSDRPIETLDAAATSVSLPESDVDLSSNAAPGE